MSFERFALAASALAFAAIGLAWLAWPEQLAPLVGVQLATATARADARAVYGGLELAIACFLLWCARDAARSRAGLVAAALCFAGLLLGRALGFALDGPGDALSLALFTLELAGASVAVLALIRLPRAR